MIFFPVTGTVQILQVKLFVCIYLLLVFVDTKCDFLSCNSGSMNCASKAFHVHLLAYKIF